MWDERVRVYGNSGVFNNFLMSICDEMRIKFTVGLTVHVRVRSTHLWYLSMVLLEYLIIFCVLKEKS